MSRYRSIFGLLALIFVVCAAVELVLRWSGAGVSLTDTRGVGQVGLFVIIIPFLIGFAARRGGGPLVFMKPYNANFGRALAGFAAMWVQAVLLMIIAYALLSWMGYVSWSQEAWANFSLTLLRKTITALLVVVVLAYTEEMIFRAFVMRHLRYNGTFWVGFWAVVIGSAIFSVTHLISYKDAWTLWDVGGLLFGLWLLGSLFAITYIATGSIACSMGVHAGLLGFKVFLRRTDLLVYQPDVWWLGGTEDIRMAPISWLLMILIAAITWATRHQLRKHFYIEPAIADWDKPGRATTDRTSTTRN
ncbi:CPBP family intramembrane glutamic endopeptidase [Arvimicrobium flavum]|uniref:CPBP family intramembrane glutamic endopeptidase n=1 Tax=Arvimicrobium flavum TaxID=3393320 RepID=UPI00237A7A87|nr:CPBP family intramembrane glutamic endopeptidase [Mesorhizobium shangrilense]